MKNKLLVILTMLFLVTSVYAASDQPSNELVVQQIITNKLLKESLETQKQILYLLRKNSSTGF